ncbi:ArnT family glycosyltransferase [Candidatus Margulisiibacteriota bacterium]
MKLNKSLLLLIVLAGLLFFFKLGSFSLYDAVETTYGEFIKQIRLTGDWITMHYNGEIIFDKPPLYFWLASIATFIFGFNEFAVRFWAAICGVLTVATTFYLGKSFYNQKVGFFSGLITMTAFQFLIQSRIAEIDILLTLLITASLLFFWQKKYLLMYLAMALGVLTKGIIGATLPGFAILLFLLFSKDLKRLKEMKIIQGTVLCSLFAVPWYAVEWLLHGQRFTEFVLGFLFLARFQGVVAGHPGPWDYYIYALILGFAPWSHFLPYSLIRTWKNTRRSLHLSISPSPELLSLCYIVPVFVVFSIAKTKLPSYMLPIYPFLAIMVGKLWADFLGSEQQTMRRGMLIANILLAIVVVMIIIGFSILGTANYSGQYQELMPNLLLLAGVLVAGSIISVGAFALRKYKISFTAIPVMVFIISLILTTQTLPAVEKYKGTKELAQKVAAVIKPGEDIAAYKIGNRPGVVFYNSKPVIFLEDEKGLEGFLLYKNGYLFTTKEEVKNIKFGRVFEKKGELVVLF